MNKLIVKISKGILFIAFLNIFAWTIAYVHIGGKKLGGITPAIKSFSQFPSLVIDVIREVAQPERLVAHDSDFESINALTYDLFALNSFFDKNKWVIQLSNLRNDSLVYEWFLEEKEYLNTGRVFSHSEPLLPVVLKDSSLVLHNHKSNNLFRLGPQSKVIWHNVDHQYHHSINPDHEGYLWTCTKDQISLSPSKVTFWDNHLTKVDLSNGEIVSHTSLAEIFYKNNLSHLVHGYDNDVLSGKNDPFHLNDIQPVFNDGPYWKRGDLFLSLRHRSVLLLYRPSTGKVVRVIQGSFFNQHDVDVLSDSTISFFNNNVSSMPVVKDEWTDKLMSRAPFNPGLNEVSGVLIYNFGDSSFVSMYPDQFVENKIFTETQGIHHILSNKDLFVDSWKEGKVYVFNEKETLLRRYFNKPVKGRVENTHWVRLYEKLPF